MSWEKGELAWRKLLSNIQEAQTRLSCTWSNPWFRGLSDTQFALLPTLMRMKWENIPLVERPPLQGYFSDPRIKVLQRQRGDLRRRMRALHTDTSRKSEFVAVRAEYLRVSEDQRNAKRLALRGRTYQPLLRLGERDAFINFQFRSGSSAQNSWQVLAEMQHHGVPTRLLDWSDVLASALFFALAEFRSKVDSYWRDEQSKGNVAVHFPPERVFRSLPTPAIWILNPYHLARASSDRNRIWDLTLDQDFDYYRQFIEKKDWLFDRPIPIYSPWRTTRIAAQRGMFLVWGYDHRPLESIYTANPDILEKVEIEPHAAVYAVWHLRHLLGLDGFSMYRDLDALGAKVKREFLG